MNNELMNLSKIPGYNVFMGRVRNLNEKVGVMEMDSQKTPDFWEVDDPEDMEQIKKLIQNLSMMIN